MADFKQIKKGLQNYLRDDVTLAALLGEFQSKPAVFDSPAPAGVEQPYICFYGLDIVPDDTHDTRGEKATFQINVHTVHYSTGYDIFSVLDDLLHRQTFTVANYTTLVCLRIRGINKLSYEENEEVVGLTADYQIMLQE